MTIPDKHTWLAENVVATVANSIDSKVPIPTRRKNLQKLNYQSSVRKTRLTLCLMGSWGIWFAPYNLARLSGLTRDAGYATTVFDFNVELYDIFKKDGSDLSKGWDGVNYWWWLNEDYYKKMHEPCLPHLRTFIQQIVDSKPDVIGFSMYDSNQLQTDWTIREIRKLLPNVKIIAGGPSCHPPSFVPIPEIDHYVVGEGEQIVIDLLQSMEDGSPIGDKKLGSTYSDNRINLDSLPMPDYSDYDLSKYITPNGVSAELSRGCVAQCSFCRETWFWKFRDRESKTILDEVEFQLKEYGTNFVWFIDSLVNGNLKELRAFCKGVVERNMQIVWMGYARNDGRMDLEFFKDIKASGCINLSFGVESGSQKVLDLMNKKVKLSEINENLINSKLAGVPAHVNWIVGFPNEDAEAAAHGLNLLWNHRNNIHAISPGMTFGDVDQSDFEYHRYRYNMSPRNANFAGWWWTLDWSNTMLNRMIRLKLVNIWLNICRDHGQNIENSQNRPELLTHYTIKYDAPDFFNDNVPNENFNHNIIETDLGNLANAAVNEVWSFLRMLWRVKGGYELTIDFGYEKDREIFGTVIAVDNYDANYYFKVDADGNFNGKFTHKLVTPPIWFMEGSKNFNFDWEGNGKWNDTVITELTHTQSGWADTCIETVSTKEIAENNAKLALDRKTKLLNIQS